MPVHRWQMLAGTCHVSLSGRVLGIRSPLTPTCSLRVSGISHLNHFYLRDRQKTQKTLSILCMWYWRIEDVIAPSVMAKKVTEAKVFQNERAVICHLLVVSSEQDVHKHICGYVCVYM